MKLIRTVQIFSLFSLLVLASCKNSDESTLPDIDAPKVTFLQPVTGDTVGLTTVTAVLTATDNNGVKTLELYFDQEVAPVMTLTAAPWQATLSIDGLQTGSHRLRAKAFDAAGNSDSASVLFVKAQKYEDIVERVALVEIVTSANCVPCGPANETYHNGTLDAFHEARIATIKYHAPIPKLTDSLWIASQTWGRPRMVYLFTPIPFQNASAPNCWVDGTNVGNKAADWISQADAEIPRSADARISIQKTITSDTANKKTTVHLTVNTRMLSTRSFSDLRLHIVVTQSNIQYNDGNIETVHYDVMNLMLPDAEGQAITLAANEEKMFTYSFDLQAPWLLQDLSVVAFLQNHTNKEVLQAAKLKLE